jgi:3-deoxy-manno-octulosonate cytidylyltransferase (CMP-KDO synthetase)
MVRHVYERASATKASAVYVVTDHPDIVAHVTGWGGKCMLTGEHHSGTDRVAALAADLDEDYIVNVQGDEPVIDPEHIDLVIDALRDGADIASLMTGIRDETLLYDYNTVKVVCRRDRRAMYFSRQAIPAHRDLAYSEWLSQTDYYQHIGLYGYRRETLLQLSRLEVSRLEKAESLEQLRWLEAGYDIKMIAVAHAAKGVDTPEDLERVRSILGPQ